MVCQFSQPPFPGTAFVVKDLTTVPCSEALRILGLYVTSPANAGDNTQQIEDWTCLSPTDDASRGQRYVVTCSRGNDAIILRS